MLNEVQKLLPRNQKRICDNQEYFIYRYYMITIILGPCIFYVPRFFELKTTHTRLGIDMTVDCEMALYPPKFNLSAFNGNIYTYINF